jgi:hypothetical protein
MTWLTCRDVDITLDSVTVVVGPPHASDLTMLLYDDIMDALLIKSTPQLRGKSRVLRRAAPVQALGSVPHGVAEQR